VENFSHRKAFRDPPRLPVYPDEHQCEKMNLS